VRSRTLRTFASLLRHAVLIVFALAMVFPFVWMLSTAAKTQRETAEVPPRLIPRATHPDARFADRVRERFGVVADNFSAAWKGAPFGRYLLNTLLVSLLVTGGVLATSVLAGYAFACIDFPARRLLFLLVLSTLMIPFEVTLLPNFLIVKKMKALLGAGAVHTWWLPEYAALVVPWIAGAFGVFLMRQHFAGLSRDFLDAARIDGCGHLRFLRYVGVPLVAPGLATVAIFAFLGSWNAFTWPLLMTDDQKYYMVQIGLRSFLDTEAARYNFMMAASTIVVTPMMLVYLVSQKFLVQGVTAGGLKE